MVCTVEVIKKGDGQTFPKPGQVVKLHYTGMLTNGAKIDCSRDRNQPFKFVLGAKQVIKAWEENIPNIESFWAPMSIGQRVRLVCPPEDCYGKRGYPGVIPPRSTLIFDLELLALD